MRKRRVVGLADGTTLGYERLVLAPGIDLRFDALPGYDEAAASKMPHAWKAGEQTALLRRQLEAMDDGGVVALALPAGPSRCPPAPYERASLIAHYLKTKKPRSKVLILDAKDAFPQQRLFENAWKELYPGMIERVSLSQGGRVTSVDPATNTIVTDFGNYTAAVANVIPPQKAGRIAAIAGAVDNTGWCPIDPVTFASKLVPNIHVIGDACLGGAIPKSASAANAQGKACADAVVSLIDGQSAGYAAAGRRLLQHGRARLCASRCRVSIRPKTACSPRSKAVVTSPVDAPREMRAREAERGAILVQDHHGGRLWLGQRSSSPPLWLAARRSPCPARRTKRDCGPMSSRAMRFRNRSRARRAMRRAGARWCWIAARPASFATPGRFRKRGSRATSRPSLAGAGSRWSEGQLRLRLVDASSLNPADHHAVLLSRRRTGARRRRHGAASRSCRRNKSRISWHISQRCVIRKAKSSMARSRSNPRAASSSASPAAPPCWARFPIVTLRRAEATPAMLAAAIRSVVGEAVVRTGKVKLDIPPLVENGNTVPMTVERREPDDRG